MLCLVLRIAARTMERLWNGLERSEIHPAT